MHKVDLALILEALLMMWYSLCLYDEKLDLTDYLTIQQLHFLINWHKKAFIVGYVDNG